VTFVDQVRRRLPEYPPYYEAPTGDQLRLDQNANLLGPNPVVQNTRIDTSQAHLYPSRDNTPLLEAAAKAFRTHPRNMFAANGSDEILDIILRTLIEPGGRVVTPHPSYSLYGHLCRLARIQHVKVPFDPEFRIAPDAILKERPDLVLLANPNNPTGTLLDPRVVGELLERFDGPVVVDEAYAEFSGTSLIPFVERTPNLLVTRTLSKAAGLAGMRVGFGVAHPDVAELIRRNKIPFSVNILSEQLAIQALHHPGHIERTIQQTAKDRDTLSKELQRRGFHVVPSSANFLLTLPPIPSEELYEALRLNGVLARVFPKEPALRDYIRFTVGRPEDHKRLLTTLDKILDGGAT